MKKTSQEKLYEAALELITAQGYENTTVLQIATKAGLTERTMFIKEVCSVKITFKNNSQRIIRF